LAQYENTEENKNFEYVFTSLQRTKTANKVQTTYSFRSDFEDVWIKDIGSSQHMTYRKYLFWNYKYNHLSSIFLVDDTTHIPQGKGLVKVFLPGIGESIISNVWYVPSFKKTLLSLILIH
jgi:hypothetical protein